MHSGQHIKTSNAQKRLDPADFPQGAKVTLTRLGVPAGEGLRVRTVAVADDTGITLNDGAVLVPMNGGIQNIGGELYDVAVAA